MHKSICCSVFIFNLAIGNLAMANTSLYDTCLLEAIKIASDDTSISVIKQLCQLKVANNTFKNSNKEIHLGVLSQRLLAEKQNAFNAFVITPHKMNYVLPALYSTNRNKQIYNDIGEIADNFESIEAKYQFSFKIPLNTGDIFIDFDAIYFGMTLKSWWQIYASNISKPFRETNYQPEFFYLAPTPWHPFDGNLGFVVGVEHQSNGQVQGYSRSWNRFYSALIFEKGNFVAAIRPWQRLSENEKPDPESPLGDDNPDIEDFLGHFDLTLGYTWNGIDFSGLIRQNTSTHKGAFELGVSFPMHGRLRGYIQYFNGYGESLIDYNHNQQTFGIGIALTDYF
ncbi:phospholipase A [Alteromonadaceae bacterium BrNp21-10]|nr:phospholipase A [Alteromonadaceae bacterium BrNp21-10]